MTSGPRSRITIPKTTTVNELPQLTLRLRMKPKAPTTGFVDGVWWPDRGTCPPNAAHLMSMAAARRGNTDHVDDLLARTGALPDPFVMPKPRGSAEI